MLSPKRTRYRKMQKGNNRGIAARGSDVSFGDFAMVTVPGSGIGPLQVSLLVLLVGALLAVIGYIVVRRRRGSEIRPEGRSTRPANRRTTSSSSRKRRR